MIKRLNIYGFAKVAIIVFLFYPVDGEAQSVNNSNNPVDKLMEFINNRSDPDEELPEQLSAELQEWVADSRPNYPDRMIPPWEFYAHIPYGSIGWRTGPGEDYWIDFSSWLMSLSAKEYSRYLVESPEPTRWIGFYKRMRISFNLDGE